MGPVVHRYPVKSRAWEDNLFVKSGGFRASTLAPISVLITSGEDPDGGLRRKSRSYCMSSMAQYMCSYPVSGWEGGDRNQLRQLFTSALRSLKDTVILPAAVYICRASTLGGPTRLRLLGSAGKRRRHAPPWGVPSKINLL